MPEHLYILTSKGEIKILLVSPEKLTRPKFIKELLACPNFRVSFVCIDEVFVFQSYLLIWIRLIVFLSGPTISDQIILEFAKL